MKAKTKPAKEAASPDLRLLRCELNGTESLKINVRGKMPENPIEVVKNFEQVKDVISTLALRMWERLTFTKADIVKQKRDIYQISIATKKEVIPIEDLPSAGISYTDPGRTNLTNRIDAAILAAEHAVENDLPLVVARYKQGQYEGLVKVLNYNLYKKGINPGNTKVFEKFVNKTGCLLFKERMAC